MTLGEGGGSGETVEGKVQENSKNPGRFLLTQKGRAGRTIKTGGKNLTGAGPVAVSALVSDTYDVLGFRVGYTAANNSRSALMIAGSRLARKMRSKSAEKPVL
jgi:hypothetical protein